MSLRLRLVWLLCFIVLLGLGGSMRNGLLARARSRPAASAPAPRERVDLLIFAPHPDDETLCCAGVILQAVAQGKTAKVVEFTSGDGFPAAAAALTSKPIEALLPRPTPGSLEEEGSRWDVSEVSVGIRAGRHQNGIGPASDW